jgi:hypothetical protein
MEMRVSTMSAKFALTTVLVLFSWLITYCSAEVWTTVYYADGITPVALRDPNMPLRDPNIPHIYVDVMVGTHLSIVISSDTDPVMWSGRLTIKESDTTEGQLWPCDFNELTYDSEESCSVLPEAQSVSGSGRPPRVESNFTRTGDHYIAMHGTYDPNTGEWFALDYHATGEGECSVFLSEYIKEPFPNKIPGYIPPVIEVVNESIFTHVKTRNFDDNGVVDFTDFALMALHFQNPASNDPNMPIDPNDFAPEYDFDQSQSIDMIDISMFMDFWLKRTE